MVSNDRAGSSPACGTIKIIWKIPKSVKKNGLDFILSNKVVMVIRYVKEKALFGI